MEGFLNLNKPAGLTSHDVVKWVRRLLGQRRVGHGGTLDPMAQGVLPIGVGPATRLLSFLQEGEKVYRAQVLLGISTTTYDAEGEVVAERPVPPLSQADLEEALAAFVGEVQQVPPPFSAIRQGGRRSYTRARAGEMVSLPPRRVRVFRLGVLSWAPPDLTLEVACGKGTYIRSLAHDLGRRLGCGAHLRRLTRLQVGPFHLEEAVTLPELAQAVERGEGHTLLLPLDTPVRDWPAVELDGRQADEVIQGRGLSLPLGQGAAERGRARAYGPGGRLLALLRLSLPDGRWLPFRVFPPEMGAGTDNRRGRAW